MKLLRVHRFNTFHFLGFLYSIISIFVTILARQSDNFSKNEIQLMPSTVYGEVNSSVILPCRIQRGSLTQSAMESYIIVWKRLRDGQYIIHQDINILNDERFKLFSNESTISMLAKDLLIYPIKKSDEGEYKCLVSNSQQVFKKVISLKILMAPIILSNGSSPIYAHFNEGATANFSCHAWGRPYPNITWYFRSAGYRKVKLTTFSPNGIYVEGRRLYMKNINRKQQGIVTCVASNGVGSEVTRDMKLDVFYPPRISMINTKIGQQVYRTTMVKAEIRGYPIRKIYWRFKGEIVRSRINDDQCVAPLKYQKYCINIDSRSASNYHEATLWISNLTESDYGHYHCFVESPFGIYENNTEVVQSHPPQEKYRYEKPDMGQYNNYNTENSPKDLDPQTEFNSNNLVDSKRQQYKEQNKEVYPASQTKNSWSSDYKNEGRLPSYSTALLCHIPIWVLSLILSTLS